MKRALVRCAVVVATCAALNLISPVVIAQQRTLHPGEEHTRVFDGPTPLSTTVTVGTSEGDDQVTITGRTELGGLDGGVTVDSYPATASSALPAAGRSGLTYLFPYRPERLSYPYTDPFAPETSDHPVALDYVGPGNVGGLDTYQYRAEVATEGYSAERIIDVQVATGEVLDETWSVARGPATGLFRLSEASRAEARQRSVVELRVLRGLQVLAWVTRWIALLALVYLAVAVARR
ncbi:hypothetical protein C3E79_10375 [Corynebacterium liangguodongii]|uniref:Uncharacterized protein n=1 Tax=Corynebacterium liangguodongii TaxID=2079535 RepID=A0A2S0WHG2_9CORY|nr:hypothetical protein C3E79_10375 [Corynebacterium liangguodongii]PWB99250.1 DUF3068 domain-containing protein [Corynebacterium liangguodongii]